MNIGRCLLAMTDIFRLIWGAIIGFFRPRVDREAEIIALRHQLNVLHRNRPERLVLANTDRLLFVWLYRLAPGILNALSIVEPETVIGWHKRGVPALWRWEDPARGGGLEGAVGIRNILPGVNETPQPLGAP